MVSASWRISSRPALPHYFAEAGPLDRILVWRVVTLKLGALKKVAPASTIHERVRNHVANDQMGIFDPAHMRHGHLKVELSR